MTTHKTAIVRALAISIAVLLVLGALSGFKVAGHRGRPRFSAGGSFVSKPKVEVPDGARGQEAAIGATTVAPQSTTTTAATTTTTSVAATTTTIPGVIRSVPATSTTTLPDVASAGLTPAADGTYTYAVQGTEGATAFGSRSFPSTMTITVHEASGVDPDTERVFDLSFSANHSEREIVQWGPSGVAWTYEAGQVAFGGFSQDNQATYSPPMLQIPADLTPGATVTGSSNALTANGSTERVEDWTDTVLGTQTLTLEGQPVPTVMVQVTRKSLPGASETTNRTTTFWYSPTTDMVVKFMETLQGSQTFLGITFTYSEHLASATLIGYSAGS